ncbi:MAG: hypothetical protein KatS3mg113_0669 [Planctomycetaceae bacterium]|nr:MAG: hypothetical protein KatS3mg113_0669 [Planctomycetaceae bacterium]
MIQLRMPSRIRLLWAGALRALGATCLMTGTIWAAEPCTPAQGAPDCNKCDQIFKDAASKLRHLNPGACATQDAAPTSGSCTNPADCQRCETVFENAARKLNQSACSPVVGGAGCQDVCSADSLFSLCQARHWLQSDPGEPWSVMDLFTDACGHNFLKDNGWQVGGWTSWGYQSGPDGAFTGNGVFNNVYYGAGFNNAREWHRLNMNQAGVYVGKVADGSEGIGFGGRVELVYGADGNEFQSFGNNPGRYDFVNGWDHGIFEWALPQLYGEVAVGKLSVKAGLFYTLVGYEVLPNTGQFFLSRQLTFYNSEPFKHTGVLGTYAFSDNFSASAGWTLGMDTGFDQLNGGNSFLGGITWTVNENITVNNYMTFGDLGWRGNGFINSLIVSLKWSEKLESVHQFDVLGTDLRFAGVPTSFAVDGVAGDSIGQINYLFYQLTPRVKAGVRQEWYKADGDSYYTLTYGLNVRPLANLVIRPEIRHMWSPSANNEVFAPGRGDLFNQTVFGIDTVLSF